MGPRGASSSSVGRGGLEVPPGARLPAAPRSRAMPGTAMDQHEQPRFPTLKIEGSQARAARRLPAHAGLALWRPVSALILLAFVLAPDARAIPSPDVVISLFASA